MDKISNSVKDIVEGDAFARYLGMEILEAKDGNARVLLPLGEKTSNHLGYVHGGAILALADLTLGCAATSENRVSVSLQLSAHFIAACPSEGVLESKAFKTGETRKLGFYTIELSHQSVGIVATAQAIAYKKTAR